MTVIDTLLEWVPVVTDGARGRELQARGLEPGDCPDALNLARPAEVEAVAAACVRTGSRVIPTNTFGANRIALAGHGLAEQTAVANGAGVETSGRAAGGQAKVFACAVFDTVKSRDPTAMGATPEEVARALDEAGADFVGGCCGTAPAFISAIVAAAGDD